MGVSDGDQRTTNIITQELSIPGYDTHTNLCGDGFPAGVVQVLPGVLHRKHSLRLPECCNRCQSAEKHSSAKGDSCFSRHINHRASLRFHWTFQISRYTEVVAEPSKGLPHLP